MGNHSTEAKSLAWDFWQMVQALLGVAQRQSTVAEMAVRSGIGS